MSHDPARFLHGSPRWVIDKVAFETVTDRRVAARAVDAFHHALDTLVTDNVTVIAYPLVWVRPGCPVWARVRLALDDSVAWPAGLPAQEHSIFDAGADELATALRLPVQLVDRYPVVGQDGVLLRVMADADLDGLSSTSLSNLFRAWAGTYVRSDGSLRLHRPLPVGREDALEGWLEENLDVLEPHGYPVALADPATATFPARQARLSARTRADLITVVARDEGDLRAGDWVVIELKAGWADVDACDQLAKYVDLLAAREPGVRVHGLLIADGTSISLDRALVERGFAALTLSRIGYRDHLRDQARERRWEHFREGLRKQPPVTPCPDLRCGHGDSLEDDEPGEHDMAHEGADLAAPLAGPGGLADEGRSGDVRAARLLTGRIP